MDGISIYLMLIGLVLAIVIFAAAWILLKKMNKNAAEEMSTVGDKKGNKKNNLMWVNTLFRTTPILSRYYAKLRAQIITLYPADTYSINQKLAKILFSGTITGVVLVLLVLVLGQGDLYFTCAGAILIYLILTETVNKKLTVLEYDILVQFSDAIKKIRHYYHENADVTAALAFALDEMPYEISLHMQNIYNIIISPNMKYEIDKYMDTNPNRYIMMFLSICSSVKDYGDELLEDGTSVYLKNLDYLNKEVHREINNRDKIKNAFAGLTAIAILPVLAVKPIEWWAQSSFPELAVFYKGLYGIVATIAVFIISSICHMVIVNLRDPEREVEKENDIFGKLSSVELLSTFLTKVISKKYIKYERINDKMKGMGDHTGPKAFLLKSIVMGLGTGLLTIIVLLGAGITEKHSYKFDWKETFMENSTINKEYRNEMIITGKDYMTSAYYHRNVPEQEELVEELVKEKGMPSNHAQLLATEIITRLESYNNTYFRWYYLIFAIALGTIGYNVPYLILYFKRNLIETRKEEEVARFQSMMLILMHMGGTTVMDILEWMERFSYCFKDSIAECRVNLSGGQKQALQAMKDGEEYGPFKDFVDNIMATDRVSVVEAFDEIKSDREFINEQREISTEKSLKDKSALANVMAFVPLGAVLVFCLVVPFVMYASEMMNQLSLLGL